MTVVERHGPLLTRRPVAPGFISMRAPLLIGLLTVVIRLSYLLANGGLHSAIEYDDGVHYGSALLLLHGKIPYRDFVFLQPPGITLLLAPAAALGRITSPFTGFAVARLLTASVAGLNAILVVKLVSRRTSMIRGTIAGTLYALSVPSIIAGSTAMIEPWLSLLMLLSLEQAFGSGTPKRSSLYAGLFAGVALTVKVWAGVFALFLVAGLLLHRRPRDARRALLGAISASTLILLPFLLISPKRFLVDTLTTQATRPVAGIQGAAARWEDFTGLSGLTSDSRFIGILSIASIAVLAACVIRTARASPLGLFMALQVVGAVIIFSLAKPYFTHYGEYLTVFLAPCVALGPPFSGKHPRNGPFFGFPHRIVAFSLLVLFGGWASVQALELSRRVTRSSVDTSKLSQVIPHAQCVVSDQMTLAILANAPTQCAWLDPRGTALTMLNGQAPQGFYPTGFRNLQPWQKEWGQRLRNADMAVLTSSPCHHPEWGPALCAYVTSNFRLLFSAGNAGPNRLQVQVWKRFQDAPTPTLQSPAGRSRTSRQ